MPKKTAEYSKDKNGVILEEINGNVKIMMADLVDVKTKLNATITMVGKNTEDITVIKMRLTKVEVHVSSMDTRLGKVENHVSSIDTRLGKVENHVSSIDTRLGKVENHVSSIDTRLGKVETDVGFIKANFSKRLVHLEEATFK